LDVVSTIILGPELIGEFLEADEERVKFMITGCPMLNAHKMIGHEPTKGTPAHCQAFCQSSVESLNPKYTLRYTKRMCTGDPHCEYVIELKT
jgi:hypothetical protein